MNEIIGLTTIISAVIFVILAIFWIANEMKENPENSRMLFGSLCFSGFVTLFLLICDIGDFLGEHLIK